MNSVRRIIIPKRSIVIPHVVDFENNTNSDIYSRLLNDRIVCLHGPVEPRMSSLIVGQLLHLSAVAPDRPIHLYVNSPGGSIDDGLAIYDTMQYISAPVHTVCMGLAASMASLLVAGGSKRFALPNARFMIHQPLIQAGGIQGQASDVAIRAKELMRMRDLIVKLYADHTMKSKEDLERALDRDNFMTPTEALSFGLIDKVIVKKALSANGTKRENPL